MGEQRPSYEELERRLERAELVLATIGSHQSGGTIGNDQERAGAESDQAMLYRMEQNSPVGSGKCPQDLTDQRTVEDHLKKTERLLSGVSGKGTSAEQELRTQPYSSLTDLNTSRFILDRVGEKMLHEIVRDFFPLLETSCAVHEKNGDYALGIFTSDWCRFLDSTSFTNCECDAQEALHCDQWHCHHACWDASRRCMEAETAVDVVCSGGIHLYAVPIRVGESIVGAINIGYGDPPTDLTSLREIADRYQVSVDELRRLAGEYQSRPQFILENAKSRVGTATRLIGEIVERKETEEVLRSSEKRFRDIFTHMCDGVAVYNVVGDGDDFLFADLNPAGLQLAHRQRDEVIGRSVVEVFPGVHEMGLFAVFQRVYRTGQPEHLPLVEYRDEHISMWVENHVSRMPSGEIVAVYTDRTELKHAKGDYETLFNKMLNGFAVHEMILDEQGKPIDYRFLNVNPAFEKIVGVKAEEIVGKTVREILPATEQEWIDTYGRVVLTGEPISFEHCTRQLERHFEVTAFRPAPGQFACIFADITDRKRAEARIRLLSSMVEQSSEGMAIADLDGNLTFVNQAWAAMHGYESVGTLLGRNLSVFHSQEQFERDVVPFNRKVMEEGHHVGEVGHMRKDGTTFPTLMATSLLRDDQSGPEAIAAVARDITQQKLSEAAIKRAANEWTLAMDAFEDVIYLLDNNRRVVLANKAFCELTGATPESVIGRHIVELLHPQGEVVPCPVCLAQEEKRDLVMTMEANHPNNPAGRPIEITVKIVRDEDGVPSGILMNLHDLTNVRATEESLRLTQFSVDHFSDAVYWMRQDARFCYVNDAACRALGYSREELLTMTVHDIGPDFPAEAWPAHWADLEKRGSFLIETTHRARGGNVFPVEIALNFLTLDGKEYNCAFARDVTDRKRAAEVLRESEQRHRTLFEYSPIPLWEQDYTEIIRHLEDLRESGVSDLEEYFTKYPGELFKCADLIKVTNVNEEAVRLFAAGSRYELMETIGSVFTEETIPVFKNSVVSIAERKRSFESEVVLQTLKNERLVCILKWSLFGTTAVTSTQDITESKRAEELIAASLKEKEVLLREIHHRVKNNMQVIISLLRMHSRRIDDARLGEVFDDCRARVSAMSLIHETLYQSVDLARIDFGDYLKKLCRSLSRMHGDSGKEAAVMVERNGVSLGMDQGMAVGMVICELVSNSFKHAFPEGKPGTVSISLTDLDEEEIEVIVQDDGIGLPPEIDIRNSPSLGLQLAVATVTGELGGSIRVERDGGTRYIIRFGCKSAIAEGEHQWFPKRS